MEATANSKRKFQTSLRRRRRADGDCVPGQRGGRAELCSPFGVVVDENIILHRKLEVRDLFTDPSETQTQNQQ